MCEFFVPAPQCLCSLRHKGRCSTGERGGSAREMSLGALGKTAGSSRNLSFGAPWVPRCLHSMEIEILGAIKIHEAHDGYGDLIIPLLPIQAPCAARLESGA